MGVKSLFLTDLAKLFGIKPSKDVPNPAIMAGCPGRYRSKERLKSNKLTYRKITYGVPKGTCLLSSLLNENRAKP